MEESLEQLIQENQTRWAEEGLKANVLKYFDI